jgi:hypothetical protein
MTEPRPRTSSTTSAVLTGLALVLLAFIVVAAYDQFTSYLP